MNHNFDFEELSLQGAYLIKPFESYDNRGSFIKDFSEEIYQKNGINHTSKEIFYTTSKKGVIRALHFQRIKQQAKIVRCISGEIFDVIVDLRIKSQTFGKWLGFYLTEQNHKMIYIPKNFAHGYLVIKPSVVAYNCSEDFYSEYDDGIIWNDPDIAINWPTHLVDHLILSDKDMNLQSFNDFTLQQTQIEI